MYKSIITLKSDLSPEIIQQIHELCNKAYDNRWGKLLNLSNDPMVLEYESEDVFGALMQGMFSIREMGILKYFSSWEAVDEVDGTETGSILEFMKKRHPELFVA